MNLRIASCTSSPENRRGLPGGEAVYRYQRRASAPWASSTVHGFTTFPLDLLIFSPASSRMCPRQMTLRKHGSPNNQRRDSVKAVEPASGLVDGFAYVVGGEPAVLSHALVLKRVVPLSDGHGPRVEPDVHHLQDAAHRAAAVSAFVVDLVDVGAVEVQGLGDAAHGLLRTELGYRAYALVLLT